MDTAQQSKRIWLDCDPGHDDALALLLAVHNPSVELLGVSSVHGNSSLANTTINAARLLRSYASTCPVFPGAARALVREPPPEISAASNIHGVSGLDGVHGLPSPSAPEVQNLIKTGRQNTAIKALERTAEDLLAKGQKFTLIATGPWTNVALFLMAFPELAESTIKDIVLMGGSVDEMGNSNDSRTAEWNVYADPEAAHVVFASALPVKFFPLDITHTAIFRHSTEVLTLKTSTRLRSMIQSIVAFFASTYSSHFQFSAGPPVHDLLCVVYAIAPEIFKGIPCHIDVELADEKHRGRTVRAETPKKEHANVWMAQEVDIEKLWQIFFEAVDRADKVSPLNA